MDRAHQQSRLLTSAALRRIRGELRDRELEVGASAHYEDADYYSATYRRRVADVAYYVDLARQAGRVLEVGTGNGRIALPMARHAVDVVGLDLSAAMLADFKRRLVAEPPEVRARIKLVSGDMRKKKLRDKFPLVVATFNTALHLFSRRDVEGFLACARHHLAPRGKLVVDLSVPQPIDLARDGQVWRGAPPFRHPTAGPVKYRERFEYDSARQVLFVTMNFIPKDGSGDWITPLAHRQFYPAEWEALLHYNGFEAIDVHGDFAGGPLTDTSDVMIWHARAR